MTTASIDLETALQILGIDSSCLEKEEIRKAYLKQALVVHPDKQQQQQPGSSAEAFTRLHNAYCVAMEHCSDGTWVKDQDVLMRAFRGHDVEADLRRAGVFRPDPMFGIDMKVPFHTVTRSQESDEEMKERMKKHIEDMFPECNE